MFCTKKYYTPFDEFGGGDEGELPILGKGGKKVSTYSKPKSQGLPVFGADGKQVGVHEIEKKKDGGSPSQTGITTGSPSSTYTSPLEEAVKIHDEEVSGRKYGLKLLNMTLGGALSNPEQQARDQQQALADEAKRKAILAGDVKTIKEILKRRLDADAELRRKSQGTIDAAASGLSGGYTGVEEAREAKRQIERLDETERRLKPIIQNAIVVARGKEAVSLGDASKVGEQIRKDLFDIGITDSGNPYQGAKKKALLQSEQKKAGGAGKFWAPELERDVEQNSYVNSQFGLAAVAAAAADEHALLVKKNAAKIEELKRLSANPNENPQRLKELKTDAEIVRLSQLENSIDRTQTVSKNLINSFPRVKWAEAFSEFKNGIAKKVLETKKGALNSTVGSKAGVFFTGIDDDDVTEQDIKDYAAYFNMPEEEVRKMKKQLDVPSVPMSFVNGVVKALDSQVAGMQRIVGDNEGADRAAVSKAAYERQTELPNSLKTVVKNPDGTTSYNLNLLSVSHTASETLGQVALYALQGYAGGQILGAAGRGLSRVLPGAEGEAAIMEGFNAAGADMAAGRSVPISGVSGATQAAESVTPIVDAMVSAGQKAGTFASGFAGSYEDPYQDALRYTNDEGKARAYAKWIAGITGASELVLPDVNLAKKLIGVRSLTPKFFDDVVYNKKMPWGNALALGMGEFAKVVGSENVEELMPVLAKGFLQDGILNRKLTTNELMSEAMDTMVQTTIGTLPLGIGGGIRNSSSQLRKEALYIAGMDSANHLQRIDDLLEEGAITPDQANHRRKVVNTLREITLSLRDKENRPVVDERARIEMTAQRYRQRFNELLRQDNNPLISPAEIDADNAQANAAIEGALSPVPDNDIAVATTDDNNLSVAETQPATSVLETIGFGNFVQEESAPPPQRRTALTASNPIAQRIFDEEGISSVEELDDAETFSVSLNNEEAITAELLGASVAVSLRGSVARFTGAQLKSFISSPSNNNSNNAPTISQTQNEESRTESGVGQRVNANQRERESEEERPPQPGTDNRDSVERRQAKIEKIGDLVGRQVLLNGERVQLYQDGQRVVATPVNGGIERDVANIEDESPLADFGIEQPFVNANGDGSINVAGKNFTTQNANPRKAIRYANDGSVQAVDLVDENGQKTTFTGQAAEDIAYQISLRRPRESKAPSFTLLSNGKVVEQPAAEETQPQSNEASVVTIEPSGIARIDGIFEFGRVQAIALDEIVYDKSFNKRDPHIGRTRELMQRPIEKEMLVFRHPQSGTVHILEGKEIYQAAKNTGRESVPVRFFDGTVEQAMAFTALRSPVTTREHKSYVANRINRVLGAEAPTFRAHVLQQMLGMIVGNRRKRTRHLSSFSLDDFARVMGFGGIDRSLVSRSFGKRTGLNDIRMQMLNGLLSAKTDRRIVRLHDVVEEWVLREGNEGVDEQELAEIWGDTLLSFSGQSEVLEALENEMGLELPALRSPVIHLHLTERELLFAADENLGELLNAIVENAGDVALDAEQQSSYESLVRKYMDGERFNMDGMANEFFTSQEPAVVSLRQKLLDYGSIQEENNAAETDAEQAAAEPVGNIGGEVVFEEENDFVPFSRVGTTLARLTAEQLSKISRTLQKALPGLKIHVGMEEFLAAMKKYHKASRAMGERAVFITQQLEAARSELKAAERAFQSKRQHLDRNVQQDSIDLFGKRLSSELAEVSNAMFDERIDPKAREAAIKPFADRVAAGKKRVNDLHAALQEAMKQGPQQTAMFHVDAPPAAEIRSIERDTTISGARSLSEKEYAKKYGSKYTGHRAGWSRYLGRLLNNGISVRANISALAKQYGLPASLLYTSAMEEGMELRFTNPNDVSEAYVIANENGVLNDFPVDGFYNYGLDRFGEEFENLVKRGLLPADFRKNFVSYTAKNEQKETVQTAAFVNDAAALQAKAAMLSVARDGAANFMLRNKLEGKEILDFATVVFYNGGAGLGAKMLRSYQEKGYLKGNAFMKSDFVPASYSGVFDNAQRRIVNARALTDLGQFAENLPNDTVMFSKDGDVLGLIMDGEVFFNPDAVRSDTPLHEVGGHALAIWARQNQPELYQKMLSVAMEAPPSVIASVRQNYPNLQEGSAEFLEEVFATGLGLLPQNIERTLSVTAEQDFFQRLRSFLKELMDAVVNKLVDAGLVRGVSFSENEWSEMGFSDFANLVGEKLLAGRRLSAPKSTNLKGYADYGLLADDDFIRDKWNNIVGVKPSVMREISREKAGIKEAAIAAGTYMLAPDGTKSRLTEDQWLTVRTARFRAFDKDGRVLKGVNGEPEVFYHGSVADFTSFRTDRPSFVTAAPRLADSFTKPWYWREDYAEGGNIKPVFVRSDKPFNLANPQHQAIYDAAADMGLTSGGYARDGKLSYRDVQGLVAYFAAMKMDYDAILGIVEDIPVDNTDSAVAVLNQANIKSAVSNSTFSNEGGDIRFQRIGEKSRLTQVQAQNLERAKRMAAEGVSNNDVFLATGWFTDNADGLWRYELPNDNVRFKLFDENSLAGIFWKNRSKWLWADAAGLEKELKGFSDEDKATVRGWISTRTFGLSDLLDYPELYEAHPDLALIPVKLIPSDVLGLYGEYNPNPTNENIQLGTRNGESIMYLTLRHEIQHALQQRLGFEVGSNNTFGEMYRNKKARQVSQAIKEMVKMGAPENEIEVLRNELADYDENKEFWTGYFYRNFAGEREADAIMNRAKLSDELRVLAPPIQRSGQTAIRHNDHMAIKPLVGTVARDERSQPERDIANSEIEFNPDGSVAFDRLTQLKKTLQRQVAALPQGSVFSMAADEMATQRRNMDIYKTLLDLTLEYSSGGRSYAEFFADPRVLSSLQRGDLQQPITSYDELRPETKKSVETILRMTPAQVSIVRDAVAKTLKSKVKDVNRKLAKELSLVEDELTEAGKQRKVRSPLRVDENGDWAPLPLTKREKDEAETFLSMLAEWRPVSAGMTTQQVKETYLKMGIALDDAMFERGMTKLALSNASMRILINQGVEKFGRRFDTVVQMVQDSPLLFKDQFGAVSDNIEAKTAFFTNVLQMGIFRRDVINKIAEMRTGSATVASNVMNLRRIINTTASAAKDLIINSLGNFGERVVSFQEGMDAEIKSNAVSEDVQAAYEAGMTEAEANNAVAEIIANNKDRRAPTIRGQKLSDKQIAAEKKRAFDVLASRVTDENGNKPKQAPTMKAIIADLNKKIKDAKC